MKTNELLSYLSDLELKLNSFSFEELSTTEATRLKKSFQTFKENLEEKTGSKIGSGALVYQNRIPAKSSYVAKKTINKPDQELLIAKVSHEIRTPLNGIIGFTELLAEESLTEKQQSHVTAIQSASNNLMNIINELLEYSKLSSGTSHFENVDFNFSSLIKDVCYLCKTLIVNPNITFNVNVAENIPKILVGDPSKLSQILLNLIGNSIKFVANGSIDLNVDITSTNEESITLNFTVKDTGIGISENNLENIFDYYKQAESDTQKQYGGTGLGLSIVKHIVQSLNGKIAVSSKLKVGTTFIVTLPFKISTASEITTEKKLAETNSAAEEHIKTMSILVFEDNTMNQQLIQNRLDFWGCKCFITQSVDEGIRFLEEEKIDLILMDLRMPEISGFGVAEIIRKHKNTKINTVPIIALTADFTVKDKDRCAKSGINDYILKPFDSKELLKKLTSNISNLKTVESMNKTAVISEASAIEPFDIDLSNILDDCFGDVDMLEELVRLFKQNVVEFIGKTKVDLKASNIDGVKFNTHKIKAGLKMMHAQGLYRIAEQMHKVCVDDQDFKYLNFLYDCFIREYPLVETAIDQAITNFKK